jgi:MYXO-CTERM domain-containing protein
MKASLRTSFATLFGSVALLVAPAALAEGELCINDIDCPGAECGGEVCNWKKPQGEEFTCNPAGSQTPTGKDGWCTTTDDCKCKAQGARCVAPYCTFTKASEAPAGGSGAGGSSGTAGSTATAGTGTAGTGTAGSASKPPAEEGGCSVSAPGANTGIALGVGLLGLGLAFARRRRA